jgi:hypothetical protein
VQVEAMVLDMVDKGLRKVARNSTATFQHCLADIGLLVHNMYNFSEWAFHCE